MAVTVNTALPVLVDAYDQEGRAEIAKAATRAEAEYRLEQVREKWRPIWQALDVFAAAHAAWATAIEAGTVTPALASEVRSAWCTLRAVAVGEATLWARASFEVHLRYPGPAYWAGSGTGPLVVTVVP